VLPSRLASPGLRLAVAGIIIVSAIGLTWTVRGPTVTRPGQVIDLTRRLGVSGNRGKLLLTTVEHGPVPVWRLVVGKVANFGRSMVQADGPTNTAAQMFDAKSDAWLNALNLVESPAGLSRETRADMLKLMPAVNTDRITGPSGGLMLALAFASLLGGGDLTGGRVVAGTGTIDHNGDVGEIGYASYKVKGAVAAGATVFFVPAGNWTDAAKAATPGVQVVAVSTFTEALIWLCQHGGHSFACDRLATTPA
jgi:PDZ domain-containing secreted protein